MIGQPHGGFPEPLRSDILKELPVIEGRPGESMEPLDFPALKAELSEKWADTSDYDVMSAAMYPHVAREFFKFRSQYGPVSRLETRHFLVGPDMGEEFSVTIEKGKTLTIKTLTPGIEVGFDCLVGLHCCNVVLANFYQTCHICYFIVQVTEDGMREVNFELNGQKRTVMIRDEAAGMSATRRMKAEQGRAEHVGAPMKGEVVAVKVAPGEAVEAGQVVAVLSAMKMEMAVQV